MRELTIGTNDAGQRLDRYLAKRLPLLPAPLAQKYIRIKRVKLNGKRADRNTRLAVGDVLQLYINDEFFETPNAENAFLKLYKPNLDILYEDDQIMLVNKAPGMVVHADETEQVNTLINHILLYLYQQKEYDPKQENTFVPALCNRIDRNTGGIVIAAKTAEALRVMNQKIRDRELSKRYLCITLGELKPSAGSLKSYLVKDEKKKQVFVRSKPVPGGRTAITKYRTLCTADGLSLVECDLITGRTHQIRAQLASAGHPLLGDGKYGRETENRRYGMHHQALWSWYLSFDFTTPAGDLEYLNGKHWQIPHIDFVEKYFPGYRLYDVPAKF